MRWRFFVSALPTDGEVHNVVDFRPALLRSFFLMTT